MNFGVVGVVGLAVDCQNDLAQLVVRAGVVQQQSELIAGTIKAELQLGEVCRAARFGGGDRTAQQVNSRIVFVRLGGSLQSNGARKAKQRTDHIFVRYVEA